MMPFAPDQATSVAVPDYLADTYRWAYVTPRAVHTFERQWLVNAILWGNYRRLRDAALNAFGTDLEGHSLQVACVYGDLTPRWLARHGADVRLDVVDVLPVQLDNLARKLGAEPRAAFIWAIAVPWTAKRAVTTGRWCFSCSTNSRRRCAGRRWPKCCGW